MENLLRLMTDARRSPAVDGAVEISTISIGSGDTAGEARVVIWDNRKVLQAHVRERALDPYYQSGSGKRNPGFSLALVYQFVAAAGGSIEVESTPGEGSAYLLRFPAAVKIEPKVFMHSV